MKKYLLGLSSFFLVIFVMLGNGEAVYASGGEEVITITLDAGDAESKFLYAIDSDAPEAFSESNTFTIAEGSSHTIYVKDAEGNISSQTYTHIITEQDEEEINIELDMRNIGTSSKYGGEENLNYEYMTDSKIDNSDANVISKITTDGSDLAEKVFYVITTEEGEEFYLVIEQGSSNKVHLLNTVTLDDLTALADDGNKSEKKDSLLEALKGGESEETGDITTESSENTNNNTVSNDKKSSNIYLYILIAIGGGAYYYFKVYKNKKNESMDIMDAMDMDDFIMEEDEDEEDLDLDEKEKQELLHQLINGEYEDEEVFQNMSLEEYGEEDRDTYEEEEIYATSHKPEDGMENILDSNLETKITEEETIESDYLMDMDGETFDEELDGEENE